MRPILPASLIRFVALLMSQLLWMTHSFVAAQPVAFAKLNRQIDSIRNVNNIPGLQVLVFTNDSLLYQRNVGVRNLKTNAPVTAQTLFPVASITKSFVAASALMLVQQGQLSLTDELKKVAPDIEFSNEWEATDPVRLVHLLEHTAGFDDWSMKAYAVNDPTISLQKGLTIDTQSRRSRRRPGTFMSYSNAGPPVVARIIEKRTGQEFEAYVRQHIFSPLGMNRSTFHRDGAFLTDGARGYMGADRQEAPYWHLLLRPTGGLNVSAVELMPFVQMLMGRGSYRGQSLLQPASVQRMETPTTSLAAQAGTGQGYGLNNFVTAYQGHLLHGHDGAAPGFRSHYLYDADLNRGLIILVNSDGSGFGSLKDAVLKAVMQHVPPTLAPAYRLTQAEKEAWLGYYRPSQFRTAITGWFLGLTELVHIDEEDGQLVLHDGLGSEVIRLRPISPRVVWRMDKRGYTSALTLVRNDEQQPVLVRSFGAGLTANTATKTSMLGAWMPIVLGHSALLLLELSFLLGFGWLVRSAWLTRRGRRLSAMPVRLGLFVYALAYLVMVLLLNEGSNQLGTVSTRSITVFTASLLGPLAALAALVGLLIQYKRIQGRADRIFLSVAVVSALAVVSYMAVWGLVGLQTWL
jgi:CubicO group peptidase (beta-lactamase class C family)